METKLNVQSIFDSIDGEENAFDGAGQLTTFIRLKGCQLCSSYCDTKYAQESKPENWMTVDDIIQQVHFPKVTITGGEPLLQREGVVGLLNRLITNYNVSVETNGTQFPLALYAHSSEYVRYVVDFKLPSSGMTEHMNWKVFDSLRKIDVIKLVISDEEDYKYAKILIHQHPSWVAKKVFSPAMSTEYVRADDKWISYANTFWAKQLVEMMIRDKVDAQYSLQLHKILWPGAIEER